MSTVIFLTGATGYIGGSVFQHLIVRKSKFTIVALVRDEERAKKLQDLGAQTVVGSLDDANLLTEQASKADVVIHCANADHMESAKAIISGLEKREIKDGKKPLMIHTSGSGVLIDPKFNGKLHDHVFNDSNLGDIEAFPKEAFHRSVEIEVLKAGQNGKIDVAIVSPSCIYGVGNGPFNQRSIIVPTLIQAGIKHKQAFYVGEGLNEWNTVHVMDLGDFFFLLLEKMLDGKALVNRTGYYLIGDRREQMKEVADKVAQALNKRGMSPSNTATGAPKEKEVELLGGLGVLLLGSNSRFDTDNVKAKEIGWVPSRAPLLDTIDAEVEYWIKKEKEDKK